MGVQQAFAKKSELNEWMNINKGERAMQDIGNNSIHVSKSHHDNS